MEIVQVYWCETGYPGACIDAAMISADGGLLGALVNGKPVLMDQEGQLLSLSSAFEDGRWTAAALSPDGQRVALASSSKIALFDLATGERTEHTVDEVHQLIWEPAGKRLGIGHTKSALSFWNVKEKKLEQMSLSLRRHRWWRVSFSGNAPQLFAASSSAYPFSNWLYAISPAGDMARHELPKGRYVTGIAPWHDGVVVALSDHAGHCELLAFSSELQPVKKVLCQVDVTVLDAPVGQPWLVSGTVDGTVWLLDAESLMIASTRMLWPAPVRTLAACAEGYVVAGAHDGRLALVELY